MSSLIDYGTLGYKILSPDPTGDAGIEEDRLIKLTSDLLQQLFNLVGTPTPNNTASTIVKRDASGNFSAGIITLSPSADVVTSDITILKFGSDPQHAYASLPFRMFWDHTLGLLQFDRGSVSSILDTLGLRMSSLLTDSAAVGNGLSAGSLSLTTPLAVTYGGTGAAMAAGARTNLGLVAVASSGSAADLTSGTLAVARGGTGVTSFGGTNRILYTTATDTLASVTTANSSVLITSAGGVPSWSTTLPAVNGSALTNLTAANVTGSHTLPDGVLSTNVPLLNASNTFSGATNTFQIISANVVNTTRFTAAFGTLGASVQSFNITQTWTGSSSDYKAISLNITNTASGSGSLLMDLQVGGASKFKVTKNGDVILPNNQYLKAYRSNGTTEHQVFALDNNNDVILNRGSLASFGDSQLPSGIIAILGDAKWFDVRNHNNGTLFFIDEVTGCVLVGTDGSEGPQMTSNHLAVIKATGSLTPLTLMGGTGCVEVWQDTTPTRAVAFGMATPGNGITDDFVFSTFDGGSWSESFRLQSGNNGLTLNPTNQPSSPSAGQIYFDTNDSHFYGFNGSAWVQLDN